MKTTRKRCVLKIWLNKLCSWLDRETSLSKREKLITNEKNDDADERNEIDYEKECQRVFHQFAEDDEVSGRRIDFRCRCQTRRFNWSHAKNDDECWQSDQLRFSFKRTKTCWIESILFFADVFSLLSIKSIVHVRFEIVLDVSAKYVFSKHAILEYIFIVFE
jgi:hypothetical protein